MWIVQFRIMRITILLLLALVCGLSVSAQKNTPQKIIIIMMDGFGDDYYHNSDMPTLRSMEKKGLYSVAPSLMPSVGEGHCHYPVHRLWTAGSG